MGNIQEYKCPCCGGAIHFDSAIQKMKCPYCDTEFEMEALQGYDEALNQEQPDEMVWDTSAGTEWGEGETNGLHTYQCQSCGGEIVVQETDSFVFAGIDGSEDDGLVSEQKPPKEHKDTGIRKDKATLRERIMSFDLSRSTPMEAMLFLDTLQKQIKENTV